jgi:hydroxyacylglutathione hydrolase
MILETVVVGEMEVNCYILASGNNRKAFIIDPGDDEDKIRKVLERHSLHPAAVINTHGHYDHIGSDDAFGVPVCVHSLDAGMLVDAKRNYSAFMASSVVVKSQIKELKDTQKICLEDIELEVRHVPGHSQGGIALVLKKPKDKIVFSGDSLFLGSIGRSDLGGNEALLVRSIKEKLLSLPDDTVVYPGHGPATSIGEERANNPFLRNA